MAHLDALQSQLGGFNFDLCNRNTHLQRNNQQQAPKYKKTGTTIVGCVYDQGVIIAADTRATAGTIVADKNCEKIHYLAPNMYCSGAGTAADTQWVTDKMSAQLELLRMNSGRESRVQQAATRLANDLYRYQGHIGAYLIIGGYDVKGAQLYEVSANGCVFNKPYATMGSGSLAAMSVMESEYKDNMSEEEAKQLLCRCIEAGIIHDLGSGSNVDLCVIKKGKIDYLRNYKVIHSQKQCEQYKYSFPKNNTPFQREVKIEFEKVDGGEKMQLE